MRLFKLIVTLVILCLIALFIYQNMQTWTQLSASSSIFTSFRPILSDRQLELYSVILLSALGGLIVGLALMLKPYFKLAACSSESGRRKNRRRRQITLRQASAESHGEAIDPSVQTNRGARKRKRQTEAKTVFFTYLPSLLFGKHDNVSSR